MHFSLWQKYGSVNKVFKKLVSLLIGICLLLGTTAMAAKEERNMGRLLYNIKFAVSRPFWRNDRRPDR